MNNTYGEYLKRVPRSNGSQSIDSGSQSGCRRHDRRQGNGSTCRASRSRVKRPGLTFLLWGMFSAAKEKNQL